MFKKTITSAVAAGLVLTLAMAAPTFGSTTGWNEEEENATLTWTTGSNTDTTVEVTMLDSTLAVTGGILNMGALKVQRDETGTSTVSIDGGDLIAFELMVGDHDEDPPHVDYDPTGYVAALTIANGSTVTAGFWGTFFIEGDNSYLNIETGGTLKVLDSISLTAHTLSHIQGDGVAGAYDVNDGIGGDAGYDIYTAVPEPGTMSLFAVGMAMMINRRRRRG